MKKTPVTWFMCLSVVGSVAASGCDALSIGLASDCEYLLTCPHLLSGSGSGGGDGGGAPEGCIPSKLTSAAEDTCGIFVSVSGNDEGAGTKAEPVRTLSEAIARAAEQGNSVYACAEEFDEAAEVPAGLAIFGGLDCANGWRWIGETAKTVVAPGEEAIALKVTRGEGAARIEDVSARAADARSPGGSSIAVLVDGAEAELVRCELIAGNGADGAEGEDAPSEVPTQAPPGNAGMDACSDLDTSGAPDAALPGGAQVENACGGALSIGGEGGAGRVNNGGGGQVGEPGALGAAGSGEPAAGDWSCAAGGTGQGGDNGPAGEPGLAASGLGMLSSSGYVGASGKAGGMGKPGQGGGGGGGAKGGASICPGGIAGAGASGGSGGPGGCGGLPGQGGGAGGASIALASVEGKVTLKDCVLKAGNGGKGGAGGDLQPGGAGGLGGVGGMGVGGSKNACAGGQGGQGGNGGPGGGGLGGPSLAIAYRGEAVRQEGQTTLTAGTAGAGGPGGSSNVAENTGAAGVAEEEQAFP
ncbi:PGRS family protein [Sorangium sp. So ce1097]|uniref:PGRS family protein n=1 Tax=Sorangium sp. So ce1097 TaxID=3133330 RepID=UPI003F62013A